MAEVLPVLVKPRVPTKLSSLAGAVMADEEHWDLTAADLYGARLSGACLFDCNLTGAELSQATLTGARLHGSRLEALRGAAALQGTTITSAQVLPVALHVLGEMGIRVEDDRDGGCPL